MNDGARSSAEAFCGAVTTWVEEARLEAGFLMSIAGVLEEEPEFMSIAITKGV